MVLLRSPDASLRQLARVLSIAIVVFLLVYLSQGKSWIYQRLPVWYAAATLIAFALGTAAAGNGGGWCNACFSGKYLELARPGAHAEGVRT